MGIPTLIKTLTASGDASLSFVDGSASVVFDGTYDEYMFVCTDINPATDNTDFKFWMSIDGGSNYGLNKVTTLFGAKHNEADSQTSLAYQTGYDKPPQPDETQWLAFQCGNGSDESIAGILHVFSPSNTTYVTHFYSRMSNYGASDEHWDVFQSGYTYSNTEAVDAIQFKMGSGNFDGVIQMYGIS